MMGECEDFTPDKILNVDGFHGKKNVKFFKWCRENKNIGKIEVTLKCDTAIKTWTPSVVNLKQDIYRERIQVFYLKSIKKDLKNTVLLHVDFTDSYKMPAKVGSKGLTLGNLIFLFLEHVLTHARMGKFASYQSLSLLNEMSTHVSLLYNAYIKL